MTNPQKWTVIWMLFLIGLLGGLVAQQQFSGGQSVTVSGALPAGTNVIGHVIADSGSTTAVTALPAIPAGANVIGHVIADSGSTTAVTALPALVAGTAKVGVVYPLTGCGTTSFESGSPVGFVALAAATTTVASSTTCVLTLVITNTGAASFTYYVTDNAATPVPVIGSSGNPITCLPGERDEYTFHNGAKFNAGVKLTASATTGAYYVFGLQ